MNLIVELFHGGGNCHTNLVYFSFAVNLWILRAKFLPLYLYSFGDTKCPIHQMCRVSLNLNKFIFELKR